MDHEIGSWKMAFVNGPTSMVQLLKEISFLKALGPALGVNRMWTNCKKNDHALESECADFFYACPKRAV
jgi:hypothetical protein